MRKCCYDHRTQSVSVQWVNAVMTTAPQRVRCINVVITIAHTQSVQWVNAVIMTIALKVYNA